MRVAASRLVLLLSSLAALPALSCRAREATSPEPGRTNAKWTLLVYMAADDDLEAAAIANVLEMAQVGSSETVNVLLQIDRAAASKSGHGFTRAPLMNLPDFNSTKRLRVERGRLTELADLGETNTGDGRSLSAFVAWGLTQYPAEKTALVLWDHGGATRGFGWDLTNLDQPLGIVDMRRGIETGLAAAKRTRFDLLGFDACLMANLGVAYELRKVADVFVGSEEVEPAHGWSYAPLVQALRADETPARVAETAVASFEAECRAAKTVDLCTLAAFDLRKLDPVVASFDVLGDQLTKRTSGRAKSAWFPVARARVAGEEYGADPGSYSAFSTVDAVDFTAGVAALEGEPNDVGRVIDEARIAQFHGAGRPRAHGLSITFPRSGRDRKAIDVSVELATHTPWQGFLDRYVGFVDADTDAPNVTELGAALAKDAIEAHARLTGDDIAEVAAIVGVRDAKGAVTVLSLTNLPVTDAAPSYRWPKTLPAMGDGTTELPVTLYERESYLDEAKEPVRAATVSGYLCPNGDASARIDIVVYLKLAAGKPPAVVGVYRYADGGRAGEIAVHPSDRFAPKVRTIDPKGVASWVASTSSIAFGDRSKIQLDERPAKVGEYVIGFRVTDLAANRKLETVDIDVLP